MRALFYYHALDLFRNIPFVTENDPLVGYLPPRYTAQQIFDYIESELNAIKDEMLNKANCPYGRASQGACIYITCQIISECGSLYPDFQIQRMYQSL